MKFRSIPFEIDAEQWHFGDEPCKGMNPYGESVIEQYPKYKGFYFRYTHEGECIHISDGDYIIKQGNVLFEHYDKEVFEEQFEPVIETKIDI